jgi:hypothetical protein
VNVETLRLRDWAQVTRVSRKINFHQSSADVIKFVTFTISGKTFSNLLDGGDLRDDRVADGRLGRQTAHAQPLSLGRFLRVNLLQLFVLNKARAKFSKSRKSFSDSIIVTQNRAMEKKGEGRSSD